MRPRPLSELERERFADWLEHEADDDQALVNQMKAINIPEHVINHRIQQVEAQMIVAKKLRAIHSV